jgi:hypothetical protein
MSTTCKRRAEAKTKRSPSRFYDSDADWQKIVKRVTKSLHLDLEEWIPKLEKHHRLMGQNIVLNVSCVAEELKNILELELNPPPAAAAAAAASTAPLIAKFNTADNDESATKKAKPSPSCDTATMYRLKVMNREGPNEEQWTVTESFYLTKSGLEKGKRDAAIAAITMEANEWTRHSSDSNPFREELQRVSTRSTTNLLAFLQEHAQLPHGYGERFSFEDSTHALLL